MGRLFVALQYLLPHHLLCRLIYALTRSRRTWLSHFLITRFVQHYRPPMDEALETDPLRYDSFNAFFTRALRPEARALDTDVQRIVSPCDGTVSVCSTLQDGMLLQAKGHRYSLEALLGGDPEWTQRLAGGAYATLYLAPYNYHRVHMPLSGRLMAAWHVPGRLFSVNATTAARVPRLFARNERVVCAFEGDCGPFAVVLVGALFVGSMSTVWHGEITPWRSRRQPSNAHSVVSSTPRGVNLLRADPTAAAAYLLRGAELGRFNMGSTVILLLPSGRTRWDEPACRSGNTCRVGQPLGTWAGPPVNMLGPGIDRS